MPAAETRLTIEKEILTILRERDPEVAMVPVPFIGSVSAVGTITAPFLDRGTINANRFDGRLIKVAEDAAAVAYTNAATVNGAHTAATTSISYTSAGDDIVSGDIIIVNASEKMLVRAVNTTTNVLTVTRGYQGTTAAAYAGGETIQYDGFGVTTAVDDGGFAAGGVLTVSPNFPALASLYGAGEFLMYPKGLTPDTLTAEINRVLRNTDADHLWIPSLVSDSDFAANDLTNWDAVNTPTTREFVTTAEHVLYGARSLHLDGADDGEGAESEDVDVTPGELLTLMVFIKVVSGSYEVVLRRVTATAANIKAATGIIDRPFVAVSYQESVPDDCRQVSVQFLGESTDSEAYISAHVVLQSQSRRRYKAPAWLYRDGQIKGAFMLYPEYHADPDVADVSLAQGDNWLDDLGLRLVRSDLDANPAWVEMACPPTTYPVGLIVNRAFSELTYDTATTTCDKEYLVAKVLANLFRNRQDDEAKRWARIAAKRASMLNYGGRAPRGEEVLTAV